MPGFIREQAVRDEPGLLGACLLDVEMRLEKAPSCPCGRSRRGGFIDPGFHSLPQKSAHSGTGSATAGTGKTVESLLALPHAQQLEARFAKTLFLPMPSDRASSR